MGLFRCRNIYIKLYNMYRGKNIFLNKHHRKYDTLWKHEIVQSKSNTQYQFIKHWKLLIKTYENNDTWFIYSWYIDSFFRIAIGFPLETDCKL